MRMNQSFETPEAKRARYETNPPKPKKNIRQTLPVLHGTQTNCNTHMKTGHKLKLPTGQK